MLACKPLIAACFSLCFCNACRQWQQGGRLYGRSLGSSAAAQLALGRHPGQVQTATGLAIWSTTVCN
jgi:hypothetical protein